MNAEEREELPLSQRFTERDRAGVFQMVERFSQGQKMAEIFDIDDQTLGALEVQAYQLYQAQQFDKARVAARGILALDEDRAISQMIVGDVALEEYSFAEAVVHLERAHELAPEILEIQARLAEALIKSGQAEKAKVHLQAVVSQSEEKDFDGEEPISVQRCRVLLENIRSYG